MSNLLGYISKEITESLAQIDTGYMARVVAKTGAAVSVEVISQRLDTEGDNTDDALVHGIPIWMPSSGTSVIRVPVKVGDLVFCLVNQTTLDPLKSQSVRRESPAIAVATQSFRRFNAQDAIAIPMDWLNQSNDHSLPVSSDDVVIAHNIGTGQEAHIILKPNGDIEIESQFTVKVKAKNIALEAQEEISLKAKTMNIQVPTTSWTGNYNLTGEAIFNGIPFSTHKHTGVTPGTGTSATPVA
ncbi:hypothetical protein [Pseudomonas sp.]|uniref:hypothetical protein n=1 Tax=Pseudomonas sp. TaxID=306 RepID=UPI002FC6B57B